MQVEPLESLIVEISYATVFGAFTLGFFTLLFGQNSGTKFESGRIPRSKHRQFDGRVNIWWCLIRPFCRTNREFYFGRLDRPELFPLYFLPGVILGSAILSFSIVNELERLSLRRALTGSLGVVVALAIGIGAAVIVFGTLFFSGATEAVIAWMESNAQSNFVLVAGGAIYGIPVGIVLGIVIGVAVLLTERWSRNVTSDEGRL